MVSRSFLTGFFCQTDEGVVVLKALNLLLKISYPPAMLFT